MDPIGAFINLALFALNPLVGKDHVVHKPVDWCDGCKPRIELVVITPKVDPHALPPTPSNIR